jgi:hypothetical protein
MQRPTYSTTSKGVQELGEDRVSPVSLPGGTTAVSDTTLPRGRWEVLQSLLHPWLRQLSLPERASCRGGQVANQIKSTLDELTTVALFPATLVSGLSQLSVDVVVGCVFLESSPSNAGRATMGVRACDDDTELESSRQWCGLRELLFVELFFSSSSRRYSHGPASAARKRGAKGGSSSLETSCPR